jgi:hypothetical protein
MKLLLILIILILTLLRLWSEWKSARSEIDSERLLPKWLVRLIWMGSIAFFQALEFQRYLAGLSYRPFFGLYTAAICAVVVWFTARLLAGIHRRQQSRLRPQSRS